MAQTVYDVIGGLKYVSGPLQIRHYKTDEAVYKNSIVRLSAAQMVRPWNGVSNVFGVAMDHAAVGEMVAVSIDPESLYEATAYGQITQSQIGLYAPLTLENFGIRVGNYSTMRITSPGNTVALTHPVQIVGLANNVTNVAAASNHKCIVKLITGELEPYVDAN